MDRTTPSPVTSPDSESPPTAALHSAFSSLDRGPSLHHLQPGRNRGPRSTRPLAHALPILPQSLSQQVRPNNQSDPVADPDSHHARQQLSHVSLNPAYSVPGPFRHTSNLTLAHASLLYESLPDTMDPVEAHAERHSPVSDSIAAGTASSSLPADDGMQQLRQQMHEIRQLAASTGEMARNMHALMVQDYLSRRIKPAQQTQLDVQYKEALLARDVYRVRPQDLVPTFHPDTEMQEDIDELLGEEESAPILGCDHYMRNVKVQCFDCHLWFTCRHCHDASPDLPFPHALNRKKTQSMLCMLCQTPQPASEACIKCFQETAYYYCDKCKLWDNDSTKRIYHCDDCGICRRGEGIGKDYVHCKRCNVCISISTSDAHPCVERATDCDCPLCLDYLFSSSTAVVSLLCGHYMHASCYKDLMNVTYRCPVCNKSAVNMELQWRKLDDEIRMQPMPEEAFGSDEPTEAIPAPEAVDSDEFVDQLQNLHVVQDLPPNRRRLPRRVWIGCNDCGGRGWTPFHWLGLKCTVCDGYNTNQTNPIGGEGSRRGPIPGTQRLQRHHDFTGLDAIRAFGGGLDHPESSIENDKADSAKADSAYGISNSSPSHPSAASYATREIPMPTRPSYFLRAELEEQGGIGRGSPVMQEQGRFSPYDILQRVGRSLSPMRYYLEGLDGGEHVQPVVDIHGSEPGESAGVEEDRNMVGDGHRQKDNAAGAVGPRGRDGSGGGDVDAEEEDDDDEEEEEEDSDDEDDDEDLIDADGDAENDDEMELFGHM